MDLIKQAYVRNMLLIMTAVVHMILAVTSTCAQTPVIDPIPLSVQESVPHCELEESNNNNYEDCKKFKFKSRGATPAFYYQAEDILENGYRPSIRVYLVNASSLEEITGSIVSNNQKMSWKSTVDNEDFQVIEKWKMKPLKTDLRFRLKWKIDLVDHYSEPFEISK